MTKIFYFIVLCFSFSLISCSNSNKADVKNEVAKPYFEKLPLSLLQNIFQECNSIDITFYNSDKTLNLSNDNVKHVLSMITNEAPLKLDDNLIGHIMMLKSGEQLAYVEVSLKRNNNYVIYHIHNEKYYNQINAKGLEFFSKFSNN
mgnify:CR=1 FL=1|tara:strand:- start:707 stop:1144 length:438 start_codon:yes stop_codon:yes gene_type:complete